MRHTQRLRVEHALRQSRTPPGLNDRSLCQAHVGTDPKAVTRWVSTGWGSSPPRARLSPSDRAATANLDASAPSPDGTCSATP